MKLPLLLFVLAAFSCTFQSEADQPQDNESGRLAGKEDHCTLVPDTGPCKANFIRYYYDAAEDRCKEFIWGGCDGVVPFESLEACEKCKVN